MSMLRNNLLAQYYAQQEALPNEYKRVEYIKSTNTQYIDTGYMPDSNTHVRGKWFRVSGGGLFGAFPSTSWSNNSYGCNGGTNLFDNYASDQAINVTTLNKQFVYDKNGRVVTLSGDVSWSHTYSQRNFTTETSLYLFRLNRPIETITTTISQLYYFKIWNGNEIMVRNYIPCIRKSDNKPGLYDLSGSICPLTGTPFYINAGTGEFVTP